MDQTVEQFLAAPFGKPEPKLNEYERKYKEMSSKKKIYMETCARADENYIMHIKVGSESQANVDYDVIILFYTNDDRVKNDVSLRRYFVKFFSNSPSFIYQYAVLYRQKGMLIEPLAEKMDPKYVNKLPDKANPTFRASFDKSIYFACRFMQDHKVSAFSKAGVMVRKKKTVDQLFRDIKSFEDVKLETDLSKLGKKIEKEAAKEKDKGVSGKKIYGKPKVVHGTSTSGISKANVVRPKAGKKPMQKIKATKPKVSTTKKKT